MKAGDLKHPITLLKPQKQTDERGNMRTVYVPAVRLMAGMADVSSRDFYAAMAAQALDVVTYYIRWREEIGADWRVRRHGMDYDILQINHLGYKRDYMAIKARRIKGGA